MSGAITTRKRQPHGFTWVEPFSRLRDMESMLSTLWGNGENTWTSDTMVPSVDLSETDKQIDVRMDIPGMKAEQIDIQINGNMLTVSGERKDEKEEKGRTFHRIERSEGSFSRTISLPCEVQENKVAAQYKDGVLNVSLPKAEAAKTHKITIKS